MVPLFPAASYRPPTLQEPYAAESTSRCSGSPDWVLLQELAYTSDRRNTTTAESKTSDGQAVEVSFWLVDPPGVSYFAVHCPGLEEDDESSYEASVICAEGALVLFGVTVHSNWISHYDYFVYRAGPGKPSLDLLPDPNIRGFVAEEFGLLPCSDAHNGHYAVAYLNWVPNAGGEPWQFDAHVFSSETRAWTIKRASQSLSKSDMLLLDSHETAKQITVGADSLGWVDVVRGILLISNLFDEHPVIQYIPLPEPRVCTTDEDGGIFYSASFPEYIRDVTCCDGLIKLVDIDFYDVVDGSNQEWIATTFTRLVSWDDWRPRFTVDIAAISVDPSYRTLLPELWNDKSKKLELKKLVFYTPTLSMQNDDFIYMMAKVNDEDEKAWVMAIDMKQAALQALAPFSTHGRRLITVYCPCTFPKFLNMIPGADMASPVNKNWRKHLVQWVVKVLWAQDWFRELDKCLEIEGLSSNECKSLLLFCPVSSLRVNIRAAVEYASSDGQGKTASKAVDVCLRVLEDFDLLLRDSLNDPSASVETMRSVIRMALAALDILLKAVPPTVMEKGAALALACGDCDEE